MLGWFRRRKEAVEVNPTTVYMTAMRLMFGHPYGMPKKDLNGSKHRVLRKRGRGFRGVTSVHGSLRSIRMAYPSPKDTVLMVFYGLTFAKSFTDPLIMYTEFIKDYVKPLPKVRIREDLYYPGRRVVSLLGKADFPVYIYDGAVLPSIKRNKTGMALSPSVEVIHINYDPSTGRCYVFVVANVRRVVGNV